MKFKQLAVAGASVLVLAGMAQPAQAATTHTKSCSKGGFTGTIRVTYTVSSRTVHRIEYKINKGSNKGGNNANVYWSDGGLLPALTASTTTGVQDNKWHTLREANYTRGSGGTAARFIFDKSLANDPECSFNSIL